MQGASELLHKLSNDARVNQSHSPNELNLCLLWEVALSKPSQNERRKMLSFAEACEEDQYPQVCDGLWFVPGATYLPVGRASYDCSWALVLIV